MAEFTIKEPTQVLVGDPIKVPRKLLKKLSSFFRSDSLIRKAYLKWMFLNNQSGYLIIIDTEEQYRKSIFPKIGEIINKYLKGDYADLVLYEDEFIDIVKKTPLFIKHKKS